MCVNQLPDMKFEKICNSESIQMAHRERMQQSIILRIISCDVFDDMCIIKYRLRVQNLFKINSDTI